MKKNKLIFSLLAVVAIIMFTFNHMKQDTNAPTKEGKSSENTNLPTNKDTNHLWYQVPELGIEFKVYEADVSDLYYKITNQGNSDTVCFNRKSNDTFLDKNNTISEGEECWYGKMWTQPLNDWKKEEAEYSSGPLYRPILFGESFVIKYAGPQDSTVNANEFTQKFPEIDVAKTQESLVETIRFTEST